MGRSRHQALRDLKMQQPDSGLPELPAVCCVCGHEVQPGDAWQTYLFADATLVRHASCAPQDGTGK